MEFTFGVHKLLRLVEEGAVVLALDLEVLTRLHGRQVPELGHVDDGHGVEGRPSGIHLVLLLEVFLLLLDVVECGIIVGGVGRHACHDAGTLLKR
jgi:hypothetical protein